MGKDCTDCLPCQQGLPCDGDKPKVRRITNFAGDCAAEFEVLEQLPSMDWNRFSEAVENCAYMQDSLSHPYNDQLEDLGSKLRSGQICHRIYLNEAAAILSKGGAIQTLSRVYPKLVAMQKQALALMGVSVLANGYIEMRDPSYSALTLSSAGLVFSSLYLARAYGKSLIYPILGLGAYYAAVNKAKGYI